MRTKTQVWLVICLSLLLLVPLLSPPAQADGINEPKENQHVLLYDGVKLDPSKSNAQFNITGYFTVQSLHVEETKIDLQGDTFEVSTEDDKCFVELDSWGWDEKEFSAQCSDSDEFITFNISGFNPNTNYDIFVDDNKLKDTKSNSEGIIKFIYSSWSTHTFSIEDDNEAPSLSNPVPENGRTLAERQPTLSIDVDDPEDDKMEVKFYNAKTDELIGKDTLWESGTAEVQWDEASTENFDYKWYVVVNDGTDQVESDIYTFDIDTSFSNVIRSNIVYVLIPIVVALIIVVFLISKFKDVTEEV